jgi:hypothetical protein
MLIALLSTFFASTTSLATVTLKRLRVALSYRRRAS